MRLRLSGEGGWDQRPVWNWYRKLRGMGRRWVLQLVQQLPQKVLRQSWSSSCSKRKPKHSEYRHGCLLLTFPDMVRASSVIRHCFRLIKTGQLQIAWMAQEQGWDHCCGLLTAATNFQFVVRAPLYNCLALLLLLHVQSHLVIGTCSFMQRPTCIISCRCGGSSWASTWTDCCSLVPSTNLPATNPFHKFEVGIWIWGWYENGKQCLTASVATHCRCTLPMSSPPPPPPPLPPSPPSFTAHAEPVDSGPNHTCTAAVTGSPAAGMQCRGQMQRPVPVDKSSQ